MKIILTNYPYKNFKIGETVDLGEAKNKSMVALGRAVWKDDGADFKASVRKKRAKKNFLKNSLREKVQEMKSETDSEELKESSGLATKPKNSLWNKWKSITSTPAVLD